VRFFIVVDRVLTAGPGAFYLMNVFSNPRERWADGVDGSDRAMRCLFCIRMLYHYIET
jgi:hypothetical protein